MKNFITTSHLGLITIITGFSLANSGCKFRATEDKQNQQSGVEFKGSPEEEKEVPTVTTNDSTDQNSVPTTPAPTVRCKYTDTTQAITEVITGSPAGLSIPISDYTKRPELLTTEGSDVSFNYTIFQRRDGSQKTLFWDSKSRGWYAVDYKATIKNADTQACTITAVATSSPKERTMRGCFTPETMITMADGSKKKIDDIVFNDKVYNPVTGNFGLVVRITKGPEASKGLYEVGFKDGPKVVVTSKHPFLTKNGLKQAEELSLRDEIAVKGGQYKKISHFVKRDVNRGQRVVNIAVASSSPDDSNYMLEADGVAAGDLSLQERLENRKALKNSVVQTK
jgi:hypothetical protein